MNTISAPVVSVIIPTFNRAALVSKAIQSVLNQSYTEFELIVVDDGSTDETEQLVRNFDDNRLIYLKQENKGRSIARNNGISFARGRYIAFLDSDDQYLIDKLQKQVTFMENHPQFFMIYTSAVCLDENGYTLENQIYSAEAEGEIYRQVAFFKPVTITLPTVMVRREVFETIGLFDEKMYRFEDTDLWRRIAKRYHIGILREPTCILLTHADNVLASQDPKKIINAIDYYVNKVIRDDADVDPGFLKSGASQLYEYYGKAFLSVAGWRHYGVQLLKRSVCFQPTRALWISLSAFRALMGSIIRQRVAKSP